jgi:hypothetical protein
MVTPTVYTPKKLIHPAELPNAAAVQYTVPAATVTQVTSLVLINTGTTPITVSIHFCDAGDAEDHTNAFCHNFVVPADGLPYEIIPQNSQGIYLNATDTIEGVASAANAVTLHISGVELA